jgi:hypothetical protein
LELVEIEICDVRCEESPEDSIESVSPRVEEPHSSPGAVIYETVMPSRLIVCGVKDVAAVGLQQ